MWSSDRDRKRAEIKARKLTPAQLAQKAHRERCFNAGFDAGVRGVTPAEVLRMVRFDHPQYLADRSERFERWDLDERCKETP